MKGVISISKNIDVWELVIANETGDMCGCSANQELIRQIIYAINMAAVQGAPWEVYEESQR
jgi:hypothetical protein